MSPAQKKYWNCKDYADSYVALALIADCRKLGLFEAFAMDDAVPLSTLATTLECSGSWLTAALEVLESIGWVSRSSQEVLHLSPHVNPAGIPENIDLLFSHPVESWCDDDARRDQLDRWLEALPHGQDSPELIERALLLPILLAYQNTLAPVPLPKAAGNLLAGQGWVKADDSGLTLTREGLRRLQQFDVMDIAGSCAGFYSAVSLDAIPDGFAEAAAGPQEFEETPGPGDLKKVRLIAQGSGHRSRENDDTAPTGPLSRRTAAAWRDQFAEWPAIIGEHGVLLLERCCVSPRENSIVPSTHALIHRYVIGPEALIVLAANHGMFAKVEPALYPAIAPSPFAAFCAHFVIRDYRIRHARMSDLAALETLEERCWPLQLRTPLEALASRLKTYPDGQFVVELDGQVVGVIYSQRIDNAESLHTVTAEDVLQLHCPNGRVAQLVAANILPEQQQRNLGDQLLEFMLQRCRFTTGVETVVAVTLCKDYYKQSELSFADYIRCRNRFGILDDPILRFHELHGAHVQGVIRGYRPADERNEGNGVLVRYDIHERRREEVAVASLPAPGNRPPSQLSEVQQAVERLIKARMNGSAESAYSRERPLMEMGLDSTDLLTLNDALRGQFGLKLDPTFFFRHNTAGKILTWLDDHTDLEPGTSEPAATVASTAVAIIGMACRLPGNINTPEELWTLLYRNESAIGSVPQGRWQWPERGGSIADYPGIDRGGFVDSVDCFDAAFFRISPREAQWMDPQQRLLLELSWEALEDAGYGARQLFDSDTAVYVGASGSDYRTLLNPPPLEVDPYLGTGSSMAVLANRLSYFHGFRGPSLTIDTACSSSLVALHQAVRCVQQGEAPQALVAGVNVICDPALSLAYYKAGMLSPNGMCRTFDAGANGYVRSEGAVVLLIKPLDAAIRDRDPVHAVIKGTASNHGGQAAGLTVPNPLQQAALLRAAWTAAGVSPETLGYIEAHGSATPLGDTIEADGLKEAFRSPDAGDRQTESIGLGSVKSNLGHLEAAAGLAGLLKAVLCLRKKALVASVNFDRLNPKIDLSGSSLYVVDSNRPWTLSRAGFPRRAGVSSFGSGGANAHAVLEEYQSAAQPALKSTGPFAISLSAKNEERLRAYARRLLEHLNLMGESEIHLPSIASTLARRELMEVRALFLVQTVAELKSSLESLTLGNTAPRPGGHVARTSPGRCIHLPPYPFARIRHWIAAEGKAARGAEALKSFTHQRTAIAGQHGFRWRFTGDEPLFQDHVIAGKRILPGVAYLEMARAALAGIAPAPVDNAALRLSGIVWLRPVVAGDEGPAPHMLTKTGLHGRVSYEVTSSPSASNGARVVHHQGTAEWVPAQEVPVIDITQLRAEMTSGTVPHDRCYDDLLARGFHYGPTLRGIESLYIGSEQILAELRLTPSLDRSGLCPTVMDAALQAALFSLTSGQDPKPGVGPPLPFALQQLDLISDCRNARWVWVRPSGQGGPLSKERAFDLDLCDEHGALCVQLRGLAFRALPGDSPQDLTILRPGWDAFAPAPSALSPHIDAHLVVMGGTPEQRASLQAIYPRTTQVQAGPDSIEELAAKLGSLAQLDHLVWIAPDDPVESVTAGITIEQRKGVFHVFRLVKALHALGYTRKELAWTLITIQSQPLTSSGIVNPTHAAIHGFVGSMAKEHPHWKIRLLDMEAGASDWPVREMFSLPFSSQGDALACRRGEWLRPVLIPVDKIAAGPGLYRSEGVYVVIGGAGGLGEAWSRMMILQYRASIVWIGRRALDAAISSKLAALAALGPAPIYIQADAADRESLQSAYAEIKRTHARIHGVIHAALVLRDESLVNMNEERFEAGLSSKLDVTVRMAQVFAAEPLDLVLFFSSILAFEKAPGQSSYAAGCTFSDAFAARLNQAWPCAVKVINWGYWGTIGAVASPAYKERMARRGFSSIEPAQGLAALQRALESPLQQVAIVAGKPSGIESQLAPHTLLAVYPAAIPACSASAEIPRAPLDRLTGGLQTPSGTQHLLLNLMQAAIQSLLPSWRSSVSVAELKTSLRGPAFLSRWLDESISTLRNAALLELEGEATGIRWQRLDLGALWSEWRHTTNGAGIALSPQLALLESCLRALPDVLTGRQSATDLLFGGANASVLERIYRGNPASDFFNSALQSVITAWLEKRLLQDPSAEIRLLEIGAGTGGATADLLPLLDRFKGNIKEYCFTDISKAFLLQAEDRFARGRAFLTTRLFDVSRPIASQTIEPDRYDVVLATNVLHATRDIRETLRNAKAALRRNGLLVLNELSASSLFTHLTFGLLPGWWLYEDAALRIPGCPGLYPSTWAALLPEEGFNSVCFPAESAHEAGQQIVVAESDGVVRQTSASPPPYADATPERMPAPNISGRGHVTERVMEDHVKTTIRESISDVLRMEEAGIRNDRSFSDYGVDSIVGVQLVRQIGEAYGIVLPTMVIFDHNNVNSLTQHLLHAHTRRVSAALGVQAAAPEMHPPPFPEPDNTQSGQSTFHRVTIDGPGDIDGLRVVEDTPLPLADHAVRISVRAFALNYADLLCVRGLYPNMPPYPFTPGLEASGIVVEVGAAVAKFRPGDPVIVDRCRTMGTHTTMLTCAEDEIFPKPDDLSFEQACVLPVVTLTMLDAFDRANLRAGERVLIQTAAGGTGLAAVQLAQFRGAGIYATAGSQEKLDYLRTLGVQHLINYREKDFELEIQRLCEGRGVDVVINTLPGDFIQKGLRCLAPGGRYVELAMMALRSARDIDLSMLRSNQSFISVDLPAMSRDNPERVAALRAEMLRLHHAGAIAPHVCKVFAFDKLTEAYRFLESRRNIGKIAVQIPEAMQYRAQAPYREHVAIHVADSRTTVHEPIAIIGMSGRFAGSQNLDEFWQHLAAGTDLIERVSRWDIPETRADADAPGGARPQCTHGSFLHGIDLFDPLFFDISGMEATCMDPQQRLMLQEAWKALEDAGYAGEQIHGHNCGVYVGCTAGDYAALLTGDRPAQAFWGNHGSVIPARISYFLNLRGPAIAVDTACSSSLVATHLACQGLWSGETDMALAGGVFVQSTPEFYELANRAGMLSPSGRCHTFDAKADGFVPGEAVVAIVLKRLRDALADGDHIHGVIRGSATNQDGRSNGITAPSAKSQEALERQVYDRFHIDPGTIQMIEAHGTGTDLGDPIEFEGLNRAFRQYTERRNFCAIGSVKTNIGHAAMASGLAGVVKVLLSLKHRQMPPSLHFDVGNPKVPLEGSPFFINTRLRDWEAGPTGVRRAAVSSFGFSGTNAHMVIESGPPVERRHHQEPGYLVVVSAESMPQLRQQITSLLAFCEANPEVDPGNLSFTLMVGRRHCTRRLAVVAVSMPEMCEALRKWLERGATLKVLTAELETTDQPENTGLRRHGNQCIEANRGSLNDAVKLENLSTVAELFIRGYRLEYQQLFGEGYSRIPLPAYPFAQESYWPSPVPARPVDEVPSHPSDNWLFLEEALQHEPLPADLDWKEQVKQRAGTSVLIVSEDHAEREDMLSLLKLLAEAAGCPDQLQLRALAASEIRHAAFHEAPDVVLMLDALPLQIEHVFHLSQALMRHAWDASIQLFYLFDGALSDARPHHEAVSGFMRSAMLELDRHVWTLVGASAGNPDSSRPQLLVKEWLCRDISCPPPGPFREVRYTSSQRLIPRLQTTTLRVPPGPIFRSDKTYLITGGFGPVGWLLCQEIARRHRSTLVVLSRGEWDTSRQQKCQTIGALGSRIHYYAVDVTDRAALRQTWGRISSEVGEIHGVIHLARLVEDGFIVAKNWESFQRVCAPKVEGTKNLDEVTSGAPLDFFAVFSSMAAFGIRGSADYGYCAAFQNAFVTQRNRLKEKGERRGHSISLCWGAWAVDKYMPNDRDENLRKAGYAFIGIEEALTYLDAACSGAHTVLGLMAVHDRSAVRRTLGLDSAPAVHRANHTLEDLVLEWERQRAAGARELSPRIEDIVSEDNVNASDPALVDRLYALLIEESEPCPAVDPDGGGQLPAGGISCDARQTVIQVVAEVLRLKSIEKAHTFQSYGLDSISATRIAVRLERRLQRVVHPRWLIDYPTVDKLAAHLETTPQTVVH